jgi:hypothetical protein
MPAESRLQHNNISMLYSEELPDLCSSHNNYQDDRIKEDGKCGNVEGTRKMKNAYQRLTVKRAA